MSEKNYKVYSESAEIYKGTHIKDDTAWREAIKQWEQLIEKSEGKIHTAFICLKQKLKSKNLKFLEDISLTSFRESSFFNISKANVNKVRNQLHKEEMEIKNFQRKTLRKSEIYKKRRDVIQKSCDEDLKTEETLKLFN